MQCNINKDRGNMENLNFDIVNNKILNLYLEGIAYV